MADATTRDELLAAYTAGTTSPGLSLLCACHLTLSAEGRDYVGALEALGGARLADDAPAAMGAESYEAVLARLDAEEHGKGGGRVDAGENAAAAPSLDVAAVGADAILFPQPIQRALGAAASEIPWRRKMRGLASFELPGFADERVSLLRATPGVRVPHHTHRGIEATLVLQGLLQDDGAVLSAGEFSLCGPDHDHHPEIVGDEECFCLVVTDGALRFKGPLGPALNLFAE